MIEKTAMTLMVRPKAYSIRLTDGEHSKLNKVIKKKTICKTVLKRCQVLRDLDETKGCGLTHAQIAHTYAICPATVSGLIRDYVNKGMDSIIRYNISPNSAASLQKQSLYRLSAALLRMAIPDGRCSCWKKKPRWNWRLHKQGNNSQDT